jgi:hypothetical protein
MRYEKKMNRKFEVKKILNLYQMFFVYKKKLIHEYI